MSAKVAKTQTSWTQKPMESVCKGEALDANGKVIGVVNISVSHATDHAMTVFTGASPPEIKALIEAQAADMARQVAELFG